MVGKKGLIMALVGVAIGLSIWLSFELVIATYFKKPHIWEFIGVDLVEGVFIAVFFQGILSMIGLALCVRALFLPKFNKILVFLLSFLGLLLNGAFFCLFVFMFILW